MGRAAEAAVCHRHFVVNTLLHRQPVKSPQDRLTVLCLSPLCESLFLLKCSGQSERDKDIQGGVDGQLILDTEWGVGERVSGWLVGRG